MRSGHGVVAVGEAAIGVVGGGSWNSHSVLGMREIRNVASVGEGVTKDDDGGVILGMGEGCGKSEEEAPRKSKGGGGSAYGVSRRVSRMEYLSFVKELKHGTDSDD